jgi:hypothetical protein
MASSSQLRQGPIGILASIFVALDLLRLILELPPVRRVLLMSELGQAVDFALEHWEHPGWLSDPWVQISLIVVGFVVIVWDARREKKVLSSPRQMIGIGLAIIVVGVVVVGVGLWRQPTATQSSGAAPASDAVPADSLPKPLKKMLTAYDVEQRERAIDQIMEMLDPKLITISAKGERLNKTFYAEIRDGTAIASLTRYGEEAKAAIEEYFQVTGRYQKFPDIYQAAVASSWNIMDVADASFRLAAALETIQRQGSMLEAVVYLKDNKFMAEWQQIMNGKTWTWINDKRNALIAKRREYEQAEVYPK